MASKVVDGVIRRLNEYEKNMQSEVKLSTLLQLSLGNPEPGAVNFNFLHALLGAILQHLDISNLSLSTDALLPANAVEFERTKGTLEAAISTETGISFQSVAPSVYNSLENRMAKVEKQLTNLDSLPENTDLLDFVFSGQSKDVLAEKEKRKMTDLWQTVQTKRRLDGLERGLDKEAIKNAATLDDLGSVKVPDELFRNIEELQAHVKRILEEKQKVLIERGSDPVDIRDPLFPHLLPRPRTHAGSASRPERIPSSPSQHSAVGTHLKPPQQPPPTAEASTLPNEAERTAKALQALEKQQSLAPSVEDKLRQLETFTNGLGEQVKRLRSGLEEVKGGLTEQQHKTEVLKAEVEDLDQQKASITYVDESLSKVPLALSDGCSKLHFAVFYDQRKLSPFEVKRTLQEKLDKSDLDSKLDRALFDQTTDGIRRIVEGLLEKLLAVETELKGIIDGLSGNILSKAEKDDLEELRKWLEKKLASLPARTKRASKKHPVDDCCQLGHLHGDGAAGIRRKIVSHFHCISCDRPLELEVDKTDVPTLPELRSFRQGRSPRPLALKDLARARRRRNLGLRGSSADSQVISEKFLPKTSFRVLSSNQDSSSITWQVASALESIRTF
ncbi:unnamed protein product [Schistocephalus solidus]|uniref:Glutamine-rich protein 2 n=1 Tax=Schistocephalus solidus TaxID=70667 RepID=A0A183TBV9_SCHSO|nr:unnamed protein product [Schistocephalus solidus]